MRHATGLLVITLCAGSLVHAAPDAKAPPPPSPSPSKDAAAITDQATMLSPIQVDSLTLTPIVAKPRDPPKKDPDLLVLDEAMPAKLVRIQEGENEDVNNLTLINKADKPLFLLAGEVIIGGKQDRIIGRNTVIPAKTTQSVPVFCVEHGRWDNKTKEFTTAKALAHGRLRGQASYAAQQDVWDEVAVKNETRKTKSATDTYRKVAQQQSDGTLASYEKRVAAALAKVPAEDRARMVGYAVALNGKVATVDLFTSPSLFKKLEGKLVKSYLTEAVDITAAKDVRAPTVSDVKTFMADADKAQEQRSYDTKAAATTVKSGMHAARSKVEFSDPYAGEKAPPAAVYQNYQTK
jgi:hypothetical protein